jgi:hypothetical protein
MELNVDIRAWDALKANKGPPRQMSMQKQQELLRQVNMMLQQKVIATANAESYSHVLLTPKPNGKWRFCVDFVKLNECTKGEGWPIPNIRETLHLMGQQRPKYFAIMDLTNGYHQAPLSASARLFTAFITMFGVFQWLRVPMGLKGAPAYFQRVMSSIVLAGLLYAGVMLYIDDICVYASDFDEYKTKLKAVLERLRAHNIKVNPTKCKFNLPEVEFVGHVINEHGITFTKERKEAVFNIDKPTVGKQLKSFIGCAEYFRPHIPNLSDKLRPLQAMITSYEKNRRLEWNPSAEKAWDQIREDIRDCQQLFFLDPNAPVFLHTDASDYGIGAYLFQIVDGIEQPIAFMSKALSDAESRWNTTEKECYAFVYAFKKFEHLIRDIHFTLRTDHRNLTYINESISPKVRRWKLLVQEYDFDIEFIKGLDNIIGDAFSRLVDKTVPSPTEKIHEETEIICGMRTLPKSDTQYKTADKPVNSQS